MMATTMTLANLPGEMLSKCLGFVGAGSHFYVAGACSSLRNAQSEAFPGDRGFETDGKAIISSIRTYGIWEEEKKREGTSDNNLSRNRISLSETSAFAGSLTVLKLIHHDHKIEAFRHWTDKAARGGKLNVCKWIRSAVNEAEWYDCRKEPRCLRPMFYVGVRAACEEGTFDVLMWFLQEYIDLGRPRKQEGIAMLTESLALLGRTGTEDILRWCSQCRLPLSGVAKKAAEAERTDLMQVLHDLGILSSMQDREKVSLFVFALTKRDINLLEWFDEHGLFLDSIDEFSSRNLLYHAVVGGSTSCVQFLVERGCELNADLCCRAARTGKLSMLQWLRANGCPWDSRTLRFSEHLGHTEVFEWALENGCPTEEN